MSIDLEKRKIIEVMNSTNWNRSSSAKLLNISRTTLLSKMRRYKIYRYEHDVVKFYESFKASGNFFEVFFNLSRNFYCIKDCKGNPLASGEELISLKRKAIFVFSKNRLRKLRQKRLLIEWLLRIARIKGMRAENIPMLSLPFLDWNEEYFQNELMSIEDEIKQFHIIGSKH